MILELIHNENVQLQSKYRDIESLPEQWLSISPEKPPIVNNATKAIANNMGVSKVIDPLYIVAIQLKTFTPVGMAIKHC